MNRLHRELAPVSELAWEAIDLEAGRYLRHFLAARRIVDFVGPTDAAALATGRLGKPSEGPVVSWDLQTVPMHRFRSYFSMSHPEIEAIELGAKDGDFDNLREAASLIAATEDRLVFDGGNAENEGGVAKECRHESLELPEDFAQYPTAIAAAVQQLRTYGIDGPYAVALGSDRYQGVMESTEYGGIVVMNHLREIAGGPIVWAPTIEGALVVSMRGGDYHLEAAHDLAVGYESHDSDGVEFYITETIGFRLDSDDTAIVLC